MSNNKKYGIEVSIFREENTERQCAICNKKLSIDFDYTITHWEHSLWTRTCSEECQITNVFQNI